MGRASGGLHVGLGPRLYLGVLHLVLQVPGARSLKDRRRAVVGLRDRIRARHEVSCNEASGHDLHGAAALIVTTGGTEPLVLRAALDRIRALAESAADVVVTDATAEVRAWPDPPPWRGSTEE